MLHWRSLPDPAGLAGYAHAVVHDGKLAGIISIGDVVNHRLDDLELETNVLRDAYIAAR